MEHVIFNQHYEKLQQYKKDQLIRDSEVKEKEAGLKSVIAVKEGEIGVLETNVIELKQDLKAAERTGATLKVGAGTLPRDITPRSCYDP